MNGQSIANQLLYSTVKINTSKGSGTGFFFQFSSSQGHVPTLITNKHVINNNPNETIEICLHLSDLDGNPIDNKKITCELDWYFHSSKDLCFACIGSILSQIEANGEHLFILYVGEDILATEEKLNNLDALEEVTMVGYPIGISDKVNNLPIFRKGYTASHPTFSFNESGIALVDMACFPGSSGSPIYILNTGSFIENGNLVFGTRLLLLGILFAIPIFPAEGEINIIPVPSSMHSYVTTNIPTNLGYYIKATEILEFKRIIESMLDAQNNNQRG